MELAKGVANRIGRKKYGYARSPTLTRAGLLLIIYKQMLDCRLQNAPYSPALLRQLNSLKMAKSTHLHASINKL